MTDDLAAFLEARLDEKEAAAKRAPVEFDGNLIAENWAREGHRIEDYFEEFPPSRALQEIEADRRLLRELRSAAGSSGGDWTDAEAGYAAGLEAGLLLAVKIRAGRFGTHPDYRADEWKP